MTYEQAKQQVAESRKYSSWEWAISELNWDGLDEIYAEAAELYMRHAVNEKVKEWAPKYLAWVNHQVIAGRTSHKLWLDFLAENSLPFPDQQ